ncbi:hypothetical protein [Clostridium fungisolvens]|uniref:Uncharacterized protein n=1 Tax=Clostridium fungisolvens TaxID=1604897 RepID=A0A6V8SAP8_9CLOT|nr:hypothetical protein [Clostridium fungisolvens]GFP74327.1 hypothetical protein bsdtw1_00374 [Clostridium fungisolvens]
MNTLELREWVVKNDIEKKTIKGFWNYYNNFLEEDSESFYSIYGKLDQKMICVNLSKVALTIVNWPDDYVNDCIIAYASIKYDDINIAEYKLVFNLKGEIVDDYLLPD